MLKTGCHLRKTTFFNTFLVVFMFFVSLRGVAQFTQHGSSFLLKKEVDKPVDKFQDLKISDSLRMQIHGTITEVCQAKGCWMKVNLTDSQEVYVKFKDYGFFVPTDVAGKKLVMNGLAFVDEMSVQDQRHYARDKGATTEEANQITKPKRAFCFQADGVRILD